MREKKEKLQEQEEPFDLKKEIFEWVKIIIAAAAIAFFLNTFIIANSTVPSGSMETTIMTGDRIIGSRLAYKLGGDPERGDIVIFDHETGPGNEETRLVKRVIGLPGETVEIRDNQDVYKRQDPMSAGSRRNPLRNYVWNSRKTIRNQELLNK